MTLNPASEIAAGFSVIHQRHLFTMKSLSLLLATAVIAFSLPACATAKKKECCGGASCDAPSAKKPTAHTHGKKKAS
jgi:hypothetical protein